MENNDIETQIPSLVWGFHAVNGLLRQHPELVVRLIVDRNRSDQRMQKLVRLAESLEVPVSQMGRPQLKKLGGNVASQGVIAELKKVPVRTESEFARYFADLTDPALLLVIDGVQDPHNLGACIRSAHAAGAHAVLTTKDRSCAVNETVYRTSAGSAAVMAVYPVTNLVRVIEWLKSQGVWIFGAHGSAETSYIGANLRGPLALVIGSEGDGLRKLTREKCDVLIKIPMADGVESLNMSNAAAVLLFEAARQRSLPH